MWIDTRDRMPTEDETYMVQTILGSVQTMMYTVKYGWNTFISSEGVAHNKNKIHDRYIARWLEAPKPEAVPKEWVCQYYGEETEG